jgi:hypothetical protein
MRNLRKLLKKHNKPSQDSKVFLEIFDENQELSQSYVEKQEDKKNPQKHLRTVKNRRWIVTNHKEIL